MAPTQGSPTRPPRQQSAPTTPATPPPGPSFADLLPSGLGPPFDFGAPLTSTPPPRGADSPRPARSPSSSPTKSSITRSHTEPALHDLDHPQRISLQKRVTTSNEAEVKKVGPGRKSLGGAAALRPLSTTTASRTGQTEALPRTSKLTLEKYELYETKTKYYVIASNQADSRYRVLKIDRTHDPLDDPAHDLDPDDGESANGLSIIEDATIYSKHEIKELLETLSAGNVGGITRVEPIFYGIAGFVRFTSTYYMILIKARAPVALIGGHYIYHCEETVLRPVSALVPTKTADEAKQYAAFHGVDLSKNFYFSYTYNLTHTLQHNLTSTNPADNTPLSAFSSMNDKFVWNRHLLRPAFKGLRGKSSWVLPMIHGFVDQAKLSVFGRTVYITLIARRSRHFAGARFLKRGVNEEGYVANDVETEQIVSEALTTPFHVPVPSDGTGRERRPNPRFTSFVQVRGSIPLFWSQETNMRVKPPIELAIVDPYFSAAALHFDDLLGRYRGPITVLNLIKQKERAPRESKLLPEFKQCIDYLNQFLPKDSRIKYIAWDIAAANKQRDKDVIGILEDIAEEALESTNFFHTGPEPTWYALNSEPGTPEYRSTPLLQTGVIRTNCIDCLDRTNAAQFVIAKAALGHQLHALGIIHHPRLPFDSDAVNLITEMYHDHGDTIALQYGGSHLVNTMETYRKIGQWTSHSRDMIENLRRYYSNSFVDADKQAAIDLFLGVESAPLAATHHKSVARRSYRDWYTAAHLEPALVPSDAQARLANFADLDGNYWQSYYRPMLFTEFGRHFAFKVNSTNKYNPIGAGADAKDHSPFVARLAAPAPTPRLGVGGVRRWMSRGRVKAPPRTGDHLQAAVEETRAEGAPLNPIEALVGRLLSPTVDPDEAREYGSYIDQFSHLSLSQDLSEKDALLYRSTAAMASGDERMTLSVDRTSMSVYTDSVGAGSPHQLLRGSEAGAKVPAAAGDDATHTQNKYL